MFTYKIVRRTIYYFYYYLHTFLNSHASVVDLEFWASERFENFIIFFFPVFHFLDIFNQLIMILTVACLAFALLDPSDAFFDPGR